MKKAPEITVVTVAAPVIEISTSRYAELIAKEKELHLLRNAIATATGFTTYEDLKRIFKIEREETKK